MTLHDISFQQRKKMLLTVPEFYSYYTPSLPVQVFKPVKNFSAHLSAIHKLLKVQKWVFDSSRGSGHSISCVSHRRVINARLITARSPDLGKSVWSVRSWLAYPLKKHCNAPPLVSQAEMSGCTHLPLTLRTHYHQSSYYLSFFLSLFLFYPDSSGRFQQCAELGRVCLLPSSSGGDSGVPAAWSDAPSPAAPTANSPRTACMYNKSYSKPQRHL